MVGCGYSEGKPRHWVMIREVVSLDMPVVMGEVTASTTTAGKMALTRQRGSD